MNLRLSLFFLLAVAAQAQTPEARIQRIAQAVRHADGRQLQRVGLQPHILVTPTLEGLRRGKDEVVERAVQFIETGK